MFLIGRCIRNPKKYILSNGTEITQYQISVRRKFRIKGSKDNTDFPWIKSFGTLAMIDEEKIKEGAELEVEGSIQSRFPKLHMTCPVCGKVFMYDGYSVETVPGSVYHGDGCRDGKSFPDKGLNSSDEIIKKMAQYMDV